MPEQIAFTVGTRPILPTTELTTVSAFSYVATAISPSIPERTSTFKSLIFFLNSKALFLSITQTTSGLNSLTCFSKSSILVLVLIAQTLIPPISLTTSRVCVPIEPVEPKMEIFSVIFISYLAKIFTKMYIIGSVNNTLSNLSSTPP